MSMVWVSIAGEGCVVIYPTAVSGNRLTIRFVHSSGCFGQVSAMVDLPGYLLSGFVYRQILELTDGAGRMSLMLTSAS